MPRPIYQIAEDIRAAWPNVNYAAQPYLNTMYQLDKITDNYFADSGRSVVLYFLANASTFRGEAARGLKAELKELLA